MFTITLIDETFRTLKDAIDLFGKDRVDVRSTIWINKLSYEEVVFAIEFFRELGVRVHVH